MVQIYLYPVAKERYRDTRTQNCVHTIEEVLFKLCTEEISRSIRYRRRVLRVFDVEGQEIDDDPELNFLKKIMIIFLTR